METFKLNTCGIPKADQVDAVLDATTFVLMYMINNCLVLPGQIENWITILNINKQGVFSVDITSLKAVISVASANFRCRPRKTFIVNTTFAVTMMWNLVSKFLHA
jgi:hypothetical protein